MTEVYITTLGMMPNKLVGQDGIPFDRDIPFYLAGPMSGYPDFNFSAFEQACIQLRYYGLTIRSPHEIDHGETPATRGSLPYETYMQAGLDLLETCKGIILLHGWPQSGGACRELSRAIDLGLPVYFYDTYELHGMNRKPPV